ncbi:MAG TPA: hypothetical protein PKC97_12605 [Burkholderiaceae bacterium]|jgi:hypothetical protein|nr:hypothetical protein [Burkholderiaceae bacterium]
MPNKTNFGPVVFDDFRIGDDNAVRHLRKPMDLPSWQGANRSHTQWYGEDLQRRHGGKDAVLGAEQCETLH